LNEGNHLIRKRGDTHGLYRGAQAAYEEIPEGAHVKRVWGERRKRTSASSNFFSALPDTKGLGKRQMPDKFLNSSESKKRQKSDDQKRRKRLRNEEGGKRATRERLQSSIIKRMGAQEWVENCASRSGSERATKGLGERET